MNYPNSDTLREDLPRHAMIVPVLSTGHITEKESQWLFSGPPVLLEVGVDGERFLLSTSGVIPQAHKNLSGLLIRFGKLGYPWIILDRDGDVIEGLPTFDW